MSDGRSYNVRYPGGRGRGGGSTGVVVALFRGLSSKGAEREVSGTFNDIQPKNHDRCFRISTS